MGRRSLRRKVGNEVIYAEDQKWILQKVLITVEIEGSKVFVRQPERDRSFYRVWSEVSEAIMAIGRLYKDGRFVQLKTSRADEAVVSQGWAKALRDMKKAVMVHTVMSE